MVPRPVRTCACPSGKVRAARAVPGKTAMARRGTLLFLQFPCPHSVLPAVSSCHYSPANLMWAGRPAAKIRPLSRKQGVVFTPRSPNSHDFHQIKGIAHYRAIRTGKRPSFWGWKRRALSRARRFSLEPRRITERRPAEHVAMTDRKGKTLPVCAGAIPPLARRSSSA